MLKNTLSIVGLLLIYGNTMAGNIGLDPGMTKALAASLYPNDPHYIEFCPDSPTGKCFGTIPNEGGFYTLPVEIQTGYLADLPKEATDGFFKWKRENGELIAELTIDTTNTKYFPSAVTSNFYNGLQINIPIGNYYAGNNFSNPIWSPTASKIEGAELEFRVKTCHHQNDDYSFTLHYYADFWSTSLQNGLTLAFNYGIYQTWEELPDLFKSAFISQGQYMRDNGWNEADAKIYDTTFIIDSHRYGYLPTPQQSVVFVDTTQNCSMVLETQQWKKLHAPIKHWLEMLSFRNKIGDPNNYKYIGGVIAGIEQWGRAKTILQVRRHRLIEIGDSPSFFSAGVFRDTNGGIYYSNGKEWCKFINLRHAGITDANQISRIETIPQFTSWCPGADIVDLFYEY